MRLRGEGNETRPRSGDACAVADAEAFLGRRATTIERPSGVSSASEARKRGFGQHALGSTPCPRARNAVACGCRSVMVPVLSSSSTSMSPAASTARPDFASTLNRTSRSMPAMPIADSRAPIVVGISVTNSATRIDQTGSARRHRRRSPGIVTDRDQEDDGEAGEQDVEGDLVRRLLPLGALDQRDHAVEEALPLRRDAHDDFGPRSPRAARDGRAVAAGFADDGRGFAGDRASLTDATPAMTSPSVGMMSPASTSTTSPSSSTLGGDASRTGRGCPASTSTLGQRVGRCLGGAERVGLRLAPPFGDRLGEDWRRAR